MRRTELQGAGTARSHRLTAAFPAFPVRLFKSDWDGGEPTGMLHGCPAGGCRCRGRPSGTIPNRVHDACGSDNCLRKGNERTMADSGSEAMQRAAQEWFRKGTEALQKGNFKYAVECFGTSAKMQPGNVLYRQTRHGSIERMYNNNGTGAKMASVRMMGIRGRIRKLQLQKNWDGVDQAAEDGVLLNPWDPQMFAAIGEAASQRGHWEVAEYAWSKAVKYDLNNIAYNRAFGKVLAHQNKFDAARSCFRRIYEADPTDSEARAMMNQLDAESVMHRGRYDQAESTRDVAAVQQETQVNAYEEDRRARRGKQATADAPGESQEADLRHAIRKDPDNLNHYLRLADYYRTERRLSESLEMYDQALEKAPKNTDVLELREDVELEILKEKLAEKEELLRRHPDKQRLKDQVAELKKKLIAREIEILEPRISRHPQDMKMKYDLADRYRRTRQYAKAIPLYQQSSADTRLKEEALVWLGECFVRDRKPDLGRRQFERALETLNGTDRPEPFKRAHYWLGVIYEKAGRVSEAADHYTEILSIDYGYRDTQKRLEQLQGRDDQISLDDDVMGEDEYTSESAGG